jgi:hypothetical protein
MFEVSRNDFLNRPVCVAILGEKGVKNTKLMATTFFAVLLVSVATPLATIMPASAEETMTPVNLMTDGGWTYIQNDVITLAFPADGKKPMFLWWHTNDPENINVVKFKGLIEYCSFEKPYFTWKCQAEAWRIKERIEAYFYAPRQHMLNDTLKGKMMIKLWQIGNATGLHMPYLPFSSSQWRLDGPTNVTRGDVEYLSFNFTLVDVPGYREHFQFAENNIIIRCRFYYTPATEDVYGKYSYTVDAGELKMDLVINHWEWNIDKLEPLLDGLRELGFDIPKGDARLALWVNLASINMTQMGTAEQDAEGTADVNLIESSSSAQHMYVEGEQVSVVQNNTQNDETPMQNSFRERFKIRFESGNATFAGFFKFVPQAIVTDGVTYNTTDVVASYVSAGAHMRVFIGYPYFGNYTLEHDPSIGVESIVSWMPSELLLVLVGVTVVVAVAVAAVRLKGKIVNIVNVH